jgi:hypothetical protein
VVADDSPARRPWVSRWRRSADSADGFNIWDDPDPVTEPAMSGEYESGRWQSGEYEVREYGSTRAPYEPGQYDAEVFDSGAYSRPVYRSPDYAEDGPSSQPLNLFAPSAGRYAPAPDPVDDPFPPLPMGRRRGPMLASVLVALVVGLVGLGGWWIASGPVGAPGQAGRTGPAAPRTGAEGAGPTVVGSTAEVVPEATASAGADGDQAGVTALIDRADISAEVTSPDGRDSAGAAVSYRVDNVADGSAVTTWRMNGDGAGRSILFSFDQQVRVTELAMTNGYTKQDRRSGADRYLEERRITKVTWTADDGTRFEQNLSDREREPQRMEIPVITTSSLTLTIDRTTEPGDPKRDYTAISEVEIGGAFS